MLVLLNIFCEKNDFCVQAHSYRGMIEKNILSESLEVFPFVRQNNKNFPNNNINSANNVIQVKDSEVWQ